VWVAGDGKYAGDDVFVGIDVDCDMAVNVVDASVATGEGGIGISPVATFANNVIAFALLIERRRCKDI
jgi:hypothetical protein